MRRPKLFEEYFDSASKIDIHNHLRQGSLALEEAWGTNKWHHRVFSTILGMVEVDTFLVYQALHADCHSINHREFTEKAGTGFYSQQLWCFNFTSSGTINWEQSSS